MDLSIPKFFYKLFGNKVYIRVLKESISKCFFFIYVIAGGTTGTTIVLINGLIT